VPGHAEATNGRFLTSDNLQEACSGSSVWMLSADAVTRCMISYHALSMTLRQLAGIFAGSQQMPDIVFSWPPACEWCQGGQWHSLTLARRAMIGKNSR